MHPIRWRASVFLSRWRNRARYALSAPRHYRNWWAWPLPKLGISTVLELRSGVRYLVRAGTTDLAVVNETVALNPYLEAGYVTLRADAIVVDVGANIGDFAIQAAAQCPRGRVYAIEPVIQNARMIEINQILNALPNLEIIVAAMGAQEGSVAIHTAGNRSSLHFGGDDANAIVPSITLAQLMREHQLDKIDLLKLDCEGAEWDILPASLTELPRIEQICMEFHPRDGWTAERLAALLRDAGYEVRHTSTAGWNGLLWARRVARCRVQKERLGDA
jgi:FkbM family methyltransferase